MLSLARVAFTLIATLILFSQNALATNECQTLSFGNFDAGTILTDQYLSSHGVTISADNNNGPDAAIIFDSSNPTGGDWDLGTPNSAYGGPGIGQGTGNSYPLGNILIIAEDVVDANNDGLVDDPDDDANGGTLVFDFNGRRKISSLKLIDIEQNGPTDIRGYRNGNQVFSTTIAGLGNNSVKWVNLSSLATNIDTLKIDLASSGAVDKIRHCPLYAIAGQVTLQGSGTPINGVTIDNSSLGQKTTSNGGTYEYSGVLNGNYALTASKPGYVVVSHPNPVSVNGANVTDADFVMACDQGYIEKEGECIPAYTISGTTTLLGTGAPISGVTITSAELGVTSTNGSGYYDFTDIFNGSYTLTASKPGYAVVSHPNPVVVNGANVTNANFVLTCAEGYALQNGICKPIYSISGNATLQGTGSPISGVSITSSLGSTSTSGSGTYSYNGVFNGTYTLNASKTGYVVVSHPNPVTVNGANVTDANFVLACAKGYALSKGICQKLYSISGVATLQGTGAPISGVSITSSIGSTSTNGSGAYSYSEVLSGTYTISASKPGYVVVSHPNPVIVNNASVMNANFVLTCAPSYVLQNGICQQTYSISGVATLEGSGIPLSGVSITSSLGSTSTNGSGAYSYSGVLSDTYNITASKPGYVVVSHPNPVIVNNANVTNANFVLTCDQGYLLQNNICTQSNDPITISASDGTSTKHVEVIWTTDSCAVSYKLYRTRTGGDVFGQQLVLAGDIVALNAPTMTYLDTSAVPGVVYDYGAIGFDASGDECTRSNVDPGYRKSEINDCDGDGISDEEELEQGTDPCDPGSFQEDLESPAFVKYNTFLSQNNFLEVQADGTEAVRVKVQVFNIFGVLNDEMEFELAPGGEYHADINSLAPGIDTYGLVKISWTDLNGEESEAASIEGRLTNYRPDQGSNTYSFAFTKELRNPVKGNTYATGNSIDPQGQGYTVPNWMEVINLDDVIRWFTYNLYNQQGEKIATHVFSLNPMSERDINGGHENGQGVYLAEVIPHDGETKYSMTVSRYSSNHIGGTEAKTYNFAFARLAQKGTAAKQYATINNDSDGCFTATNWVEVANTLGEDANADVLFRDDAGVEIGNTSMNIAAKSQFHFNASALLGDKKLGSVEVRSSIPGALIMQSITYYHDCQSNLTQTAYMSEGRIAGDKTQQLSYNRFLDIENRFNAVNVTGSPLELLLDVFEGGNQISSSSESLSSASSAQLDLNDEARFSTQANTYGVLKVTSPDKRQVITEVLRVRRDPNDPSRMDFVIATR